LVTPLCNNGAYVKPFSDRMSSESVKFELADDGNPAPAAVPGDWLRSAVAHPVAGRIQTAEN
jgi:hypothetical protein